MRSNLEGRRVLLIALFAIVSRRPTVTAVLKPLRLGFNLPVARRFAQPLLRNAGQLVCIDPSLGMADFICELCHFTDNPALFRVYRATGIRPRARKMADLSTNSATGNATSADRNHHSKQRRGRCPKRNCCPTRPTPVGSECGHRMTMPTNRQRRQHQVHQANYVDNRHSPTPCFHLTVPPAPVAK